MPGGDIRPTKPIELGQAIAKYLFSSMGYDDVNV